MSDLAEQIDALLALNAKGVVSHPVPGLAVDLLTKAAEALRASPSPVPPTCTCRGTWPPGFHEDHCPLHKAQPPVPVTITDEMVERLTDELASWLGKRPNYEVAYDALTAALSGSDKQ